MLPLKSSRDEQRDSILLFVFLWAKGLTTPALYSPDLAPVTIIVSSANNVRIMKNNKCFQLDQNALKFIDFREPTFNVKKISGKKPQTQFYNEW